MIRWLNEQKRFSRSILLSLLSEACELEHSLACSYLFAAFSLRRDPADGLTWEQCRTLRLWAAQVFFVASQEMLHLAQAWNFLTAVGGTPWWSHRQFPQERGYVTMGPQLTLEPYSLETLERFVAWERPRILLAARNITDPYSGKLPGYCTVGELYDLIEEQLMGVPERTLFIMDPALQIGPEVADFPDLIRITDRQSAHEAIRHIQHQGEGTWEDRTDCHFGIFSELHTELFDMQTVSPEFVPAFPVLPNPKWRDPPDGADQRTLAAMELFDNIYDIMLRIMSWVFGRADPGWAETRELARLGIQLMPEVLDPLGRILARIPVSEGIHAGAPFSLGRAVPFPEQPSLVVTLLRERMNELASDAHRITNAMPHHPGLAPIEPALRALSREFLKNEATGRSRRSDGEF